MSVLDSNRWVVNECRRVWLVTRLSIPAFVAQIGLASRFSVYYDVIQITTNGLFNECYKYPALR